MTTRITGLATGLDVDAIVKSSMLKYTMKVDTAKQKQEVLEIKQKLYRDVITSGKDFYNKYFDIAKGDSLLNTKSYSSVSFESTDASVATATGTSSAVKDNYEVTVSSLASAAKKSFSAAELSGDQPIMVTYNGKTVTIPTADMTGKTEPERAKVINTALSTIGLKASTSDFTAGILIESATTGALIGTAENSFTGTIGGVAFSKSDVGTNLQAAVTSSKGTVTYDGTGEPVSASNTITLDGVQFSLNAVGTTTVSGKIDVTETKDKLVNFVNDYNTYIEKLNTLVMDTHDRSYTPLTTEQKEAMSEDEITLWNAKVEKGQLTRDSDLSRIVNSLKSSMASSVSGISSILEKIGITPVEDYQTPKNGTFTIDDSKLTTALEANPQEIMKLFIQVPESDTLSDSEKFSQTGILYRMKDILNNEFVSSTNSPLINKAGIMGTASFTQSSLSKSISDYKSKITEMETALATREQAFYSKYAKLEVLMNNFNTQQSSLASMLGTSS
ncbi:flagellar filament capping protein FliD [Clostridium vincentii]|uniref:Flagellar hook-associated protein 2 n=1 Tax=Clostridium vincentii TaxID=52704 RepID=A0A2T0BG24_9CLOT|nr:flagellar filament capping protein FliD [Clostridium vincentii]PRR82840.1 flagellar capping protein [Clostridium vincentii]